MKFAIERSRVEMRFGACGWGGSGCDAMPELCGSLILGKSNLCGWAQASAEGAALSTLPSSGAKGEGQPCC